MSNNEQALELLGDLAVLLAMADRMAREGRGNRRRFRLRVLGG
jgi:hypothetical protein